jgi:kynureninase
MVLWSGVNYFTGEAFDLVRLTEAAHRMGCVVGLDLAHAVGNVPLRLHEWGVDFAVWCHYKYVNAGPGAVGGCFVHARHGHDLTLPRLAGWWGNDPASRFRMHLQSEFVPVAGADGWQVSNPPILALAPLRSSLALFDEAGMPALRNKSIHLTGYLEALLRQQSTPPFEILTPTDPTKRGCQLSLRLHDHPRERLEVLRQNGVVCDFREPDVIRVAPVPLYNSYHDVWQFVQILSSS